MNFKIDNFSERSASSTVIKLRCPTCRQRGTFDIVMSKDLLVEILGNSKVCGMRRCPDPSCHALVFFGFDITSKQVVVSYPSERIDFDSTDIPAGILESIEEAISCHANRNYIAAAIMIRKTLEEICSEKEAEGKDLKERIEKLREKIVIPEALLTGMTDLRFLGNDAAHIKSKVFDEIGQEEVEIALEFTKKILESLYQLSGLLNKLKKLQKAPVES